MKTQTFPRRSFGVQVQNSDHYIPVSLAATSPPLIDALAKTGNSLDLLEWK
jgi:hypothetical protein